jgi:16S rRNA (uracil1498-N3)-methyltransferase
MIGDSFLIRGRPTSATIDILADSREEIAWMADRFYVNLPLAVGLVTLEGAEAHHLASVRRFRPGDCICLFNGDGREFQAEVLETGKKHVGLKVVSISEPRRELSFRLDLAAPLPKGDRAQILLEKLTELGASSFTPLQTARSVVHPREAKLDKLKRYVIEASKQCGRNVLLRVEPLMDWERFCQRVDLPALRILAHPGGSSEALPKGRDVLLAVGPEGGFTDDELAAARAAGWRIICLGPRTLRVETAAILLAALATQAV